MITRVWMETIVLTVTMEVMEAMVLMITIATTTVMETIMARI